MNTECTKCGEIFTISNEFSDTCYFCSIRQEEVDLAKTRIPLYSIDRGLFLNSFVTPVLRNAHTSFDFSNGETPATVLRNRKKYPSFFCDLLQNRANTLSIFTKIYFPIVNLALLTDYPCPKDTSLICLNDFPSLSIEQLILIKGSIVIINVHKEYTIQSDEDIYKLNFETPREDSVVICV
jgi:hypothetical protein|uniref:Uncharacterized protein n=1 Tax=viral metagenome TaxID=1070528 RepID=A0A6C0IUN8_9ZZZZ